MKQIIVIVTLLTLSVVSAFGQEACLTTENLKKIDASWELAQLELDYEHVNAILSEAFIWVHNHANTIDDKAAVLERIKRYIKSNNRSTKSRISKDVEVIISGKTGIVSGITLIEKDSNLITYHFMRTYVEIEGNCYLLANHTMAIPEKE